LAIERFFCTVFWGDKSFIYNYLEFDAVNFGLEFVKKKTRKEKKDLQQRYLVVIMGIREVLLFFVAHT